ncbi:beta-galactosidase [soil metagenome]
MTNELISHAGDLAAPQAFPWIADGLAYGGDYSPEQWPEEVWLEDVALMREAGVNSVNLGVFAWGLLEVEDGVFEWGWLDRIMDLLHENGVGVNLATPTAAPPMWLLRKHPEITTVDADGRRTGQGGRLGWAASSATFRRYALRMVEAIATRYAEHPALRLWHVSNELSNENGTSYDPETAVAFRAWLESRYGSVAAVNSAWGTAFWGHHYTSIDQIEPPRHARTDHNPGFQLDYQRFSSDALLDYFRAEREVLRTITPGVPITTNFMVMNSPGVADYRRWAAEVDLVANDHYTIFADPQRHSELAFSADRTRGIADGRPWLLIEHSTAAVNWQRVNLAKGPGEMRRNSLAHVARGADGALFFQFRASTAGAEQFHSAIVPHAGRESQIFRDAAALGADLRALAPVRGSVVQPASVALLFDYEAAMALRSGRKPSDLVTDVDLPIALHRAFTAAGVAVDVVTPGAPLDDYSIVLAPTLYLVRDDLEPQLSAVVQRGGHVLASYLTAIVDDTNRVREGGYPAPLRELLGVRVDEVFPLFADETVLLDNGHAATLWTERVEAADADVLVRMTDGPLAGGAAVTRRTEGAGSATYVAVRPDADGIAALVADLIELSGVAPVVPGDAGIELTRRVGDSGSFVFAINHTTADLAFEATGVDLLTSESVDGRVILPAGGVRVIQEKTQ